jgi:hypothetical protein
VSSFHSREFAYSMGALEACRSVYTHFVASGRDVVFPKNTAMHIGISVRHPSKAASDEAAKP